MHWNIPTISILAGRFSRHQIHSFCYFQIIKVVYLIPHITDVKTHNNVPSLPKLNYKVLLNFMIQCFEVNN